MLRLFRGARQRRLARRDAGYPVGVNGRRDTAFVAGLVRSIADRRAEQHGQLAMDLARRCWPMGGDRTDPAALRWVTRWRPERAALEPPACACVTGRCAVCN